MGVFGRLVKLDTALQPGDRVLSVPENDAEALSNAKTVERVFHNPPSELIRLTIGGTAATSGTAYTLAANQAYAIDETLLDGYTFTSITGDTKCPAALGGTLTLDEGDDITCTITNDDVAPKLPLVKHPTNDDGGNAEPDDFLLTIGGNAATSGTEYTLDGGGACPPEDCGGVPGYYDCIRALREGDNSEELLDWLGRWRPDRFDPAKIKFRSPLRRLKTALETNLTSWCRTRPAARSHLLNCFALTRSVISPPTRIPRSTASCSRRPTT